MDDGEILTALRGRVGSTNVALLVSCEVEISEEVSVGVVPCKTLVNVSAKVGVASAETSLEGPSEDVISTEEGVGVPSVLTLLLGESSTSERLVVLLNSVPDGITCEMTPADGATCGLTLKDGVNSTLMELDGVILTLRLLDGVD